MGKFLLVVGVCIAILGCLVMLCVPLGRLPGDIIVRRGRLSFYLPLATAVLLSVLLTVLSAFFRR